MINLFLPAAPPKESLRHASPVSKRAPAVSAPTRALARVLITVLFLQSTLSPLLAQAQITPDKSAPSGERAIMDAARNGVPIAHIAPPSRGGVSRNQFDTFNVAPNGLILNNSTGPANTQLSGWIAGNMQLGGTPARIILNEVSGTQGSQLSGTIEVAGARAGVVVANPNGISCDGCGFINTGRATLTTGQPQTGADGSLAGFDVRAGQLSVTRGGLSAPTLDQLDLIARGITLDGEIWTSTLHAIAGANKVLYDTLQASAQSGTGSAPRFAIDIKDLGGMFARQIYLVATEQGLGVNSTGRIAALEGNLVLTADGDLRLKDSSARHDMTINISGKLDNTGRMLAGGNIALTALTVSNAAAPAPQPATPPAPAAEIFAGKQLMIDTTRLDNAGILSGQQIALTASDTLTNTADGVIDGSDTRIDAGTVDNTGRIFGDTLQLRADIINNSNNGLIAARERLDIGAQYLNNTAGGVIASLGDLNIAGSIDSAGQPVGTMQKLTNASSRIEAHGDLAIDAAEIINRNDGLVTEREIDPPIYYEKVQPVGSATQYPVSLCSGIGGGQDDNSCIVHPDKYGQRSTVTPVRTQACTYNVDGMESCITTIHYAWDSPAFAEFNVAPVTTPPPVEPAGGCSVVDAYVGAIYEVNSAACNQWRGPAASWDAAYQSALNALDAAINTYNASVNEDNRLHHFEDYTLYKLTEVNSRTIVTSTAPGEILSGGNMRIAGSLTNHDSHVVAGGALDISGPAIKNIATQGEDRTDISGTAQFSEVRTCGFWPNEHHCRIPGSVFPYQPAPISILRDLPTVRVERGVGPAANTALPDLSVPASKLFVIHPQPAERYLVESDPRFTSFRQFISSDHFLRALDRDPARAHKRFGDGFTEQQLVNDQILALTGRRYLDGYTSTEQEYTALMNAGVAFSRAYQLSPGVALSAEQMALLTTDIVLLTARTVTLADGTTQQVLAPQVYLRRPANGDLHANGALIAATNIALRTSGDLQNSGTIAGDTISAAAGGDLVNRGHIRAQTVHLRASNDLKNLSGSIVGSGGNKGSNGDNGNNGDSSGSNGSLPAVSLMAGRDIVLQTQTLDTINETGNATRKTVQRIATVQGGDILLAAGGKLIAKGARIEADGTLLGLAAGGIAIGTVAAETDLAIDDRSRSTQGRTGHLREQSLTHQSSTLAAGGNIALATQGDVLIKGAQIDAGGELLVRGQSVEIAAVRDRQATDLQTIGKRRYDRVARDDETLVASTLSAQGKLSIEAAGAPGQAAAATASNAAGNVAAATAADTDNPAPSTGTGAGTDQFANAGTSQRSGGNIVITGSVLHAQQGPVVLAAGGDIRIANDSTRHVAIDESYSKSGNLLGSVSTTRAAHSSAEVARASAIIGNSVSAQAGRDLLVQGSAIAADGDLALHAARDATISAGTSTLSTRNSTIVKESGLLSGGGMAINIGTRSTETDAQTRTSLQSESRSLVSSLAGNVTVAAGDALKMLGSDMAAAGDLTLSGHSVKIDPGRDEQQSQFVTRSQQNAVGLSLGGSVVNAAQTTHDMAQAAGQTDNPHLKALAAASSALAVHHAASDVAANGPSVSLSLTMGRSKSEQTQTQTSSIATGSTLVAGKDLQLRATGAGDQSQINVTGSTLAAGGNVELRADKHITLDAALDRETQHSQSRSSSAAAGMAVQLSSSGVAFGPTASASTGRAQQDGDSVTAHNTQVSAGQTVTLQSGGDTRLRGALVAGQQVRADVGGDLDIASVQDTARFDSKSQGASAGFAPGSASVSLDQQKVQSDYASVQQQSGLRAGDGGFQVKVAGDASLTGAVIASTDAAVNNNKNSFSAKSLTTKDIANQADYQGTGFGVGIGIGADSNAPGNLVPSTGAGVGTASDSAASLTRSGISGIAGNDQVRSTDQETGIRKIFDAEKVARELNAQVQITKAFDREASRAVKDYTTAQRKDLQEQLKKATTEADKQALQNQIKDLNLEERVLNVLVGAVAGLGVTAATKESLSMLAEQMRQITIEESKKFAGVTDGVTTLSNMSGESEGVRGDGFKAGGTRVDLDVVCGKANERCRRNPDQSLEPDERGQIVFLPDLAGNRSLDEFVQSPDAEDMVGPTGGIQGAKGTLFGFHYAPGSLTDKLIEAFSGAHDLFGGSFTGLYDEQGNIKRGMSKPERRSYDYGVSPIALVPSVPFAAAELLSPEVWKAISIILKAAR